MRVSAVALLGLAIRCSTVLAASLAQRRGESGTGVALRDYGGYGHGDSTSAACKYIGAYTSNATSVYYSGPQYDQDLYHWLPSSSLNSTCTVEPGSVDDISTIIQILGQMNVNFGIKSGGHATDQNQSSTTGVLIAMARWQTIKYDASKEQVTVPVGTTWDKVYSYLEPYNRTVVGGRIKGVGVAGFVLGGGYSYLTSRYGLTFDNVVSFDLILPNGTFKTVTKSDSELWFGLRGGFQNFGIVTQFVMPALKQGPVYAGIIEWKGSQIPAAIQAISDFSIKNTNVDAAIVGQVNGSAVLACFVFYNGPNPSGAFGAIETIPNSGSTAGTKGFVQWLTESSTQAGNVDRYRGVIGTAFIQNYSVNQIKNLIALSTDYSVGGAKSFGPNSWAAFSIEPFVPSGVVRPISDAAWPHNVYNSPVNVWWGWLDPSLDAKGHKTNSDASNNITALSQKEGFSTKGVTLYPNYVQTTTSPSTLYGDNLAKLNSLQKKYDPKGVMLKANGFKFA